MNQLAEKIEDIAALLKDCGESHWSAWLAADAARLRRGDAEGLFHFLEAFGGMGSLNDLYLCPQNGHRIAAEQVDALNERLARQRSSAWTLASALAREERSG